MCFLLQARSSENVVVEAWGGTTGFLTGRHVMEKNDVRRVAFSDLTKKVISRASLWYTRRYERN
jgi:hypothetical protein